MLKANEIVAVSIFFMHLCRQNQNSSIQLFLVALKYSHFFVSGFDSEG